MASLEERVEALEAAVAQISGSAAGVSGQGAAVSSAAALLLGPDEDEVVEEEDEFSATPAAEELAEAEGVDLSEVEGSGVDGKILVSDVQEAADEA